MPTGRVLSVSRDLMHRFSKVPCNSITLAAALGVVGDAHAGTLVQHRSRVRRDPNQENLRQVHLLHAELFAEAAQRGHQIGPGESITTRGVPLLDRLDGSRSVRRAGVMGVVERVGERSLGSDHRRGPSGPAVRRTRARVRMQPRAASSSRRVGCSGLRGC